MDRGKVAAATLADHNPIIKRLQETKSLFVHDLLTPVSHPAFTSGQQSSQSICVLGPRWSTVPEGLHTQTSFPLQPSETFLYEHPPELISWSQWKSRDHKSKIRSWSSPQSEWISWFHRLKPCFESLWRDLCIFEALDLSTRQINPNPSIIAAASFFWSTSTNSFHFPWGFHGPEILDVCFLTGFGCSGDSVSSLLLEDCKILPPDSGFSEYIRKYKGEGDTVSFEEHCYFLVYWLSKFVIGSPSLRPVKDSVRIAAALASGRELALAPFFLALTYRSMFLFVSRQFPTSTPGTFWFIQVWLYAYFPELRPTTVPVAEDILCYGHLYFQGHPSTKKFSEFFAFFYNQSYTTKNRCFTPFQSRLYGPEWLRGLSTHLSSKNISHVHFNVWRCALVARNLPVCLTLKKSVSTLRPGVELYSPCQFARQFGLVQAIPGLHFSRNSKYLCREEIYEAEKLIEILEDYNRRLGSFKPISFDCVPLTFPAFDEWWTQYISSRLGNRDPEGLGLSFSFDADDGLSLRKDEADKKKRKAEESKDIQRGIKFRERTLNLGVSIQETPTTTSAGESRETPLSKGESFETEDMRTKREASKKRKLEKELMELRKEDDERIKKNSEKRLIRCIKRTRGQEKLEKEKKKLDDWQLSKEEQESPEKEHAGEEEAATLPNKGETMPREEDETDQTVMEGIQREMSTSESPTRVSSFENMFEDFDRLLAMEELTTHGIPQTVSSQGLLGSLRSFLYLSREEIIALDKVERFSAVLHASVSSPLLGSNIRQCLRHLIGNFDSVMFSTWNLEQATAGYREAVLKKSGLLQQGKELRLSYNKIKSRLQYLQQQEEAIKHERSELIKETQSFGPQTASIGQELKTQSLQVAADERKKQIAFEHHTSTEVEWFHLKKLLDSVGQ